jgi:Fic family protein
MRTVFKHTEEEVLPELAKTLRKQKKKKNFHGLYDYVVIDLTYSSCRMASNRLTRGQVESIYRKGKIRESFEPLKVSDVIEALNHIHCVDYILDHVMEPLDTRFIRKLHELLMAGTVDAYRQRVRPGEYRTTIPKNKDRPMIQGSQIHSSLTMLIEYYETRAEIERNQILEFHVRFEQIHPFDDGNGRVGRLIMFKECLRHDIMPFILDDKRRSRYLQGIREWFVDRYELVDVVMEAQSRFESQIELQKLQKAAEFYQPEEYKEGLKNEDE